MSRASHLRRLEKLEEKHRPDFDEMSDGELRAWVDEDRRRDPDTWEWLDSLSDEELEAVARGEPVWQPATASASRSLPRTGIAAGFSR